MPDGEVARLDPESVEAAADVFLEAGALGTRVLPVGGGFSPMARRWSTRADLLIGNTDGEVKDGDAVFLSRKHWLLRPGQLVHAELRHGRLDKGFYVPMDAIASDSTGHGVFVVHDADKGREKTARVPVTLGTAFGNLQSVKPDVDGALADGMKLIVDGAHYLRDGEAVNAFKEVEPKP